MATSDIFRFAEPRIPGCIFSLEVKSVPYGTGFYWQATGTSSPILYLKMYVNRQLQEMQNVSSQGAEFILPGDLSGMVHFEAEISSEKNICLIEFEL